MRSDRLRADGHVTPDRVAWPADDRPAAFVDLLTCLERAFAAYDEQWQEMGQGVDWTGPERGGIPMTPDLSVQLGPDGMAYQRRTGGTFITALLSVALQLGIEQGKRQERRRMEPSIRSLALTVNTAASTIRALERRIEMQRSHF